MLDWLLVWAPLADCVIVALGDTEAVATCEPVPVPVDDAVLICELVPPGVIA